LLSHFEIAAQFTSDILIAGNTVVTTRGHPKLGSTEPFPVAITPGHAGNGSGLVERVWIVNNVFDAHGVARRLPVNHFMIALRIRLHAVINSASTTFT
jgi:hypothetical protein